MDIGSTEIVSQIVTSTGDYLTAYQSVFLLVGGLVLAYYVCVKIISLIFPKMGERISTRENYVESSVDDESEEWI